MNEIKFLCGCSVPLRSRERVVDEDTVVSEKVIDGEVNEDAEGLLVCRAHGMRRHGWRSLPLVQIHTDDGELLEVNRSDYRFASKSFKEIERHVLATNGVVLR